ncbi:Mite allergen Der p 7 [Sarcoptes scabiei]|uniref:Mite allergen Der p 7 n=1 Tax=Sarcoptes scabiei TaxID=52283 RepID=A0A834RH71_SARSC|nr:Mite allergen Der p 7 [Sarcoptes scabiei]
MFKIFALVFLTIAIANAATTGHHRTVEKFNKYADDVICKLENKEGFDPMNCPDFVDEFDRKIGLLDFQGQLSLTEIKVLGLHKLERACDATVRHENGDLRVHFQLKTPPNHPISMQYNLLFHMQSLHPQFKMVTDIEDFVLELTLLQKNGTTLLIGFELKEFTKIKNHVGGMTILNPLLSFLFNIFMKHFDGYVRSEMSQVLAPAFKRVIESHSLNLY